MEDENLTTPQEGMNPELEVEAEETTTEEETVETPEVYEETVPKSQFNQVLARAKAAEAKLKAKPAQTINQTPALSEEQVHVAILKAQGKSQDEIDYLKKIAGVNKTTLIDAQNDELFAVFQKKREDEAKAQKAKLGASRGSGTVKKEKTLSSPGLTDAEHKELWKAQNGR